MKNKRFLLLILLLLGVSFAAVSTTVIFSGRGKIATNNADFNVIFTKAVLDETDISSTAIIEDGKKISFGTNDLVTVGDISKLDFEVTNNSTMYDAEVSIECTATGAKRSYYEITKEVASPIAARTKRFGKVQVKLLKAPVDNIKEEFVCTLNVTATERTTKVTKTPVNVDILDVRFVDADFPGGRYSISEDGRSFSFNAGTSTYHQLIHVGDKSTFEFEVKNYSEMYDAEVSIDCSSTGPKSDYYKIESTVASPVYSKRRGSGRVVVTLEKESVENVNGVVTCELTATSKEKSTHVEPLVDYIPKYFAYGDPTTSSTQDYTTIGRKAFFGLDADGTQKSVCIVPNDVSLGDYLFCIKTNDYTNSVARLEAEFGKFNCGVKDSGGDGITCSGDNDFSCTVLVDGGVQCQGPDTNTLRIESNGRVSY